MGQHSLAVTQTGGGFSWDAYVSLTGDALNAFSLALTDNHANYRLEFDVTYDTASIPQNGTLNFLNESVAIQNAAGTWSQVDSVGSTNGHTNQTIHVAIPLTRWTGLTAGSGSYTIYFGLNGNWGSSAATVYFRQPGTCEFDRAAHRGTSITMARWIWRTMWCGEIRRGRRIILRLMPI